MRTAWPIVNRSSVVQQNLRNNPGGILRASVDVAGLFLDGGNVVYTEGRVDNSDMSYDADPLDVTNGVPLVVLINQGSASASENGDQAPAGIASRPLSAVPAGTAGRRCPPVLPPPPPG